jgi:fumarylacetoacetate (FAA) hydrolase
MYQGGSHDLLGPMGDIVLAHEEWDIDFVAEMAVVTGDVPMGATPDGACGRLIFHCFLLKSDQTVNV